MIAISYRREDSLPVAGRLYDRLQTEFGKGNVFMDFDSIPYGVDFRDHIKQMIDQSKVLVAMIGPDWVGKRRHRGRRIDDPGDFVRIEIAYALNRKLPIIPVLVGNAQMPSPEQLPKDIEGLAFRNAITLDAGIDFHHHAERLATAINRLLTTPTPPKPEFEETRPPEISAPPHVPLVPPESRLEAIQPPSVPTTQKPLRPELVRTPPIENEDETRGERTHAQMAAVRPAKATPRPPRPPIINWQAKISAITATFRRLGETTHNALSAAKSRAAHFFNSAQTSARRCVRVSTDLLYRHRKPIGLSALWLLVAMIGTGAVYWGLRSGTFQLLVVQTTEFFKSRSVNNGDQSSSPQPSGAVPRGSENPFTASPITSPAPAQIRGALFIDSTPQGEAYEVIDANNKHHIGKTPETLEDLPGGYAQVIFKREGFSDHAETAWIAADTRPSATWNFPETHRVRPATAPSQNERPTALAANEASPSNPPTSSPTMNPAAQNGRSWQTWIGDFAKQFVAVNQSQDAEATVSFYAPTVDYFGDRQKDHAYILGDIQKYNAQWPRRLDSIDGDVRVEDKTQNQQYRANFKLKFYAENSATAEWSKGEMAVTLDINILDGVPRIAAVSQKRLQRQVGRGKGPRPPEMEAALQPINPQKLAKVFVKKYGFSVLLPTDLFPDAETKLADGNTDRLNSVRGCATVSFSSSREMLRKVYDDYLAQFRAAPNHRAVDYKVIKDNWFVISGGNKTTGYYTKGVKRGDDVFLMQLEYAGKTCNIPNAMLTEISQKFDGKLDTVQSPGASRGESTPIASPSSPPTSSPIWRDGTEDLPIPDVSATNTNPAWVNRVKPNQLENLQSTRQFVFSTNLEITPDKLHPPLAGPAEFQAMLKLLTAPLLPISEKDVLGEWRHRSIDVVSMGVVVHLFHKCRFSIHNGTLFFERLGGSQVFRRKGNLYRNDANSFVFIGTKTPYGDVDQRVGPTEDSAGILVKKAGNRFLMILDPTARGYELYEIVK